LSWDSENESTRAGMATTTQQRHIKFAVDEDEDGEGEGEGRTSGESGNSVVEVRFGLVKERHTYVLDFAGPGGGGTDKGGSFSIIRGSGNVDVTIAQREGDGDGGRASQYRACLFAARAGLVDELIHASMGFDVHVLGKVMGINRGTPSLRDGVHCVGVASAAESEDSGSEWSPTQAHAHPRSHNKQ
jgi:hypothetical protein